ncbi:MAG: 4Fe-4S dicluster domain-containing protein, partial [Anaerohalosphaera sp.]|nr:4Fe-4S dicluster domain-containing protein [Anaerohalosphaera sp.]
EVELNSIRICSPVKEFLFPAVDIAASYPKPTDDRDVEPFAVFGLKECDLRSIEILDKVFVEDDFEDTDYTSRREKMLIVSTDCLKVGESCFCSVFGGQGYSSEGYDLNVSKVEGGYVVESGSDKGAAFIESNRQLFGEVTKAMLSERQQIRARVKLELKDSNSELNFKESISQLVLKNLDSEFFDDESKDCVECQACTRICPTCHCFYLHDSTHDDHFVKIKMWDSCVRNSYAAVAGGENPRKTIVDRARHRMLHKFVYFLDRYGIEMCVGCGRCVDACAGKSDIRETLKQMSKTKQASG